MAIRLQVRARSTDADSSVPVLDAAELAAAVGLETGGEDLIVAGRVLASSWARIVAYAPGAPTAILKEATIRFSGYLVNADFGTIQSETIGPLTTQWTASHANAFRLCGAAGLLSRWRVRRAGAIA